MREINKIKISVRNLVEFVLRAGDLDTRFMGSSRAVEGTRAHQKIQKASKDNYMPEVTLKHELDYRGFLFNLEGRADGVIEEEEGYIIDEIKSTTRDLEFIDENYNELHWAQGKCYGYIYAADNSLDNIQVQLTYYQLDTEEIKRIKKTFTIGELREFFYDLLDKYFVWANLTKDWLIQRNAAIKLLEFPFDNYRRGQRELAVAAYKTITEGKKLFVQAPTGIGKTISTIFPAIKAMGEGATSKIFYLTAKTITRQVAEEAILKMTNKGLSIKAVTLTAKDKICFSEGKGCNPEDCQYAKGHFNRVNDAMLDILKEEGILTREIIEDYAKKHNICPFEFSLDLAIWADCVICDYNYVFDPRVYLKRFFADNNGDYTFLIDESHNLVDRAREMFSATLRKRAFLDLKRVMKDKEPKISKVLNKLNSYMLDMKKKCENNNSHVQREVPDDIYALLRKLIKESEEWLVRNEKLEGHQELLDLYFDALAFVKIGEIYDERFVTYVEKTNEDTIIKLFCLDPSFLLREAIKRGKTAIYFSATLAPLGYFREILGGSDEDYVMQLSSPFSVDNLCLLVGDKISTRYKNRAQSYDDICQYIKVMISEKVGNYLVFFPSYQYMNKVYELFVEYYPGIQTILQSPIMVEEEREEFLNKFIPNPKESLVAFAVLGGIFSEGIDLKGDRLSGAAIIGVGLPQICLERDIIKNYFQDKNGKGYDYAYMYPGMNKVLQGAGRVIRSEEDKGIVMLIDERFSYPSYKDLFPVHWSKYCKVRDIKAIGKNISEFWSGKI